MADTLNHDEVGRLVADVVSSFQHEQCKTCDCFQGYLTQLELDSGQDVTDITAPHKVPRSEMHGCLGCDPCPPGSAFADYLKRLQQAKDA